MMLKKYSYPLKSLKLFIFLLLFSFAFGQPAFAQQEAFINIVNPVRGNDFWHLNNQKPLDAVGEQLKIIEKHQFSATWLLRPDVIFDQDLAKNFNQYPQNQEIGLFLEVTPSWTDRAGIPYHQGISWHLANSIFLSGYKVEERTKLIDAAFAQFKQLYGYYPKSVGAWHIDAYSLNYMQKRYGTVAALLCSDQFSTDTYQIWGSWWGVPYYPSRYNSLTPAQTVQNKINLVIIQWAERDLIYGYGGSVESSIYSVQANDYLQHQLNTSYFSQLADVYLKHAKGQFGQITIGLENDNSWLSYGKEYQNQIEALAGKKARSVTMKEFAAWYQKQFPKTSPDHELTSLDLLKNKKKATWFMSTAGRLGIIEEDGKIFLRDWRLYNENWPEPYLETANVGSQLFLSLPYQIDSVRFPRSKKEFDGNFQSYLNSKLKLPFKTPASVFMIVILLAIFCFFLFFRKNKWLIPLCAIGMFTQTITMFKSGLLYPFGMGFWGPNGHDGIWHIALINSLTKYFPAQNPVFSGTNLANYHYFFDLFVAILHKVFSLPVISLYFQILPVLFSGLLGYLTYCLVFQWTKNRLSAIIATFFAYFGGSFGWIVTLFRDQAIGGESMFWASQSVSYLINPPFILSLIFILYGLLNYLEYLEKPTNKRALLIILVFGLLIGIKAYAGIIILSGLLVSFIGEWFLNKEVRTGKIFFGSLALSLLIFLPTNRWSLSLFVFSPLWFPHTMIEFSDRLGWIKLAQARQAYQATGNWGRLILTEGLTLFIFFLGNLGTRLLFLVGLYKTLSNRNKVNVFTVLVYSSLLVSAAIPLLVIQKGNPWNSIQFFYYFLFLSGLLASEWLGNYLLDKSKLTKIAIVLSLFIFTIPTTLSTLSQYLPYRAPARISFEELEALNYLKNEKEGVVLTFPYNSSLNDQYSEPKPLFAYETTAYVSALSEKPVFLEDEMNLEIMGVNWVGRKEDSLRFFSTDNKIWANQFLKENKINYIYLLGNQRMNLGEGDIGAKKIFENGEVKIYEVLRSI